MPAAIFDKVEWVEGDILDISSLEESMEGIDAVIHAAARVSFQPGNRKELYKTNIEGTANVVNASIAGGVGRFIHISSVAALGETVAGELTGERRQWEENIFTTHYAVSKYQAEMEAWRGMGEGLNVSIVNPSTILGYGDWNNGSCAIFKSLYQEFPWYTEGMNGFVDVRDVARAVFCLLESDTTGERFILSSDNWTYRRLFDCIADGLGKRRPPRKVTRFLAALAWRFEKIKSLFTGKEPVLTRESAKIALKKSSFDNRKFLARFPDFHFTTLDQTILAACKSYLQDEKSGNPRDFL